VENPDVTPIVAIIAPGNMGAAVGSRLTAQGVTVLTSFASRSAASVARAKAAGMKDASDAELVQADFLLSIVPPKHALGLAERLAPALTTTNRKPIYVDCNAVSPATAERIAAVVAATGAPFVDGGIIGGPPREGYAGPKFYVSGADAHRVAELNRFGLIVRVVDGPVGAASALKLSYAGINKGMIALGATMVLAARRAGVEADLLRELSESRRSVLAQLSGGVPDMFGKAERWAPEMDQIADYADDDAEIFSGMARLYERLAVDLEGDREEIDALKDFFAAVQR
jgi:3-hydroxyisobutyrate dehydrogenase-like beta-hydroxyacid dehydrogenase